MLTVYDTILDTTKSYEDIEDFRTKAKDDFDKTVWGAIDQLSIAYAMGDYTGDLESYLGIEFR